MGLDTLREACVDFMDRDMPLRPLVEVKCHGCRT